MHIEPIAGGRLRIWLSESEWQRERENRRELTRLVRRAYAAAGHRPTGRLTVEMIPVEGGGLMLVSPAHRPRRLPAVYWLTEEGLLGLARQWPRAVAGEEAPHLALYEGEGGYALAVYPLTPLTAAHQRLLTEYGTLWGQGQAAAAHWGEYGRPIAAGAVFTARVPRLPAPEDPSR